MFAIRQPSIEALRAAPVYFRYGSNKRRVLVDGLTARALLACYDALKTKPENAAKFERMVTKDAASLHYLAAWCFKRVSF